MKTADELGISPMPWEEDKDTKVIWGGEYSVHERSYKYHYQSMEDANARLIAAAPELYDCLRESCEERCDDCTCENCSMCIVSTKWRKALAKAGGEEVPQ